MVDTAIVFQIENERAAEAEILRAQEEEELAAFVRRNREDQSLEDCLNALLKRQRELAEVRDSPNLREHVVRMEK